MTRFPPATALRRGAACLLALLALSCSGKFGATGDGGEDAVDDGRDDDGTDAPLPDGDVSWPDGTDGTPDGDAPPDAVDDGPESVDIPFEEGEVIESCPGLAARCDGRACGDDGAGGSCGTCPSGRRCGLDGQCAACTGDCSMIRITNGVPETRARACGDDGCGGSCGTCPAGRTCFEGECLVGETRDADELWSMYYINEYRETTTPRVSTCLFDGETQMCEDRPYPPSRLNADMVRQSRLWAFHVVTWRVESGEGFCGHHDPLDDVGSIGDRFGGFLGEQGVQNAWCGYVSPEGSPITADPWHCCAMLIEDATDWGLAWVVDPAGTGGGYGPQDIGTDAYYLPVVVNSESVTTSSRDVEVFVLGHGIRGRPFSFLGDVVQVQISEDPCFVGTPWVPYAPLLPFRLSEGNGRKVVYAKAMDGEGMTAVSWDSIFLGPEPASLDTYAEGIRRIRSVRLPPLERAGFDAFQVGMGAHRELESMPLWWGHDEIVDDPDASGGQARNLAPGPDEMEGLAYLYVGGTFVLTPGDGVIYARLKVADNTLTGRAAWVGWREDSGGLTGGRDIMAGELDAPATYQWFAVPYTRTFENSLMYIEIAGNAGTLVDRIDIFSAPQPTAPTLTPPGVTLDFETINDRGTELLVRFVDTATGLFEDGPRINPYCSLCGEP
jgi:hypothetical protein